MPGVGGFWAGTKTDRAPSSAPEDLVQFLHFFWCLFFFLTLFSTVSVPWPLEQGARRRGWRVKFEEARPGCKYLE